MSKEVTKKSDIAKAILAQLKDPFKPNLVKYTNLGGNKRVAYVDARDVEKRLDDVLGTENWEDEYIEAHNGFICKLTLVMDGKKVTKSGVSDNTKIAPMKGGESGALKRAAVKFGIGRYFYYFDPLKWTANNVEQWPDIFKPGAPEDWEALAELQYGLIEGMDEDFGEEVVDNLDKIREIDDVDKLLEFFNSLDTGQQSALGKEFKNRSEQLNAQSIAKALQEAKDKKD